MYTQDRPALDGSFSERLLVVNREALRAALARAEEEVVRVEEEMKYFKMELRNREQNFNQVFGGGPNVGVMSVGGAAKVGQAASKMKKGASLPPVGRPGSGPRQRPGSGARRGPAIGVGR